MLQLAKFENSQKKKKIKNVLIISVQFVSQNNQL